MPARTPAPAGALALLALLVPGCYSFRVPGPEDPSPVQLPRSVRVSLEYRQPNGCHGLPERCGDPVVFFATWMQVGGEFRLTPDPAGSHVWTGTAFGVPVNFPPRDEPYEVRIFDPHVQDTPGATRYTAQRLTVGGETLAQIENPGGLDEHGLIYIDDNGQGRNPF